MLAITQLVGWGTMSLPAVIGEQLARDLGLSLPAVFAGTTVKLVVSGLTSPLLANAFVRYGARRVMAVGSLIAAPGFLAAGERERTAVLLCGLDRAGHCGSRDAVDADLYPAE